MNEKITTHNSKNSINDTDVRSMFYECDILYNPYTRISVTGKKMNFESVIIDRDISEKLYGYSSDCIDISLKIDSIENINFIILPEDICSLNFNRILFDIHHCKPVTIFDNITNVLCNGLIQTDCSKYTIKCFARSPITCLISIRYEDYDETPIIDFIIDIDDLKIFINKTKDQYYNYKELSN